MVTKASTYRKALNGYPKKGGHFVFGMGIHRVLCGKVLKNYNPLNPFVLNKTFGHELLSKSSLHLTLPHSSPYSDKANGLKLLSYTICHLLFCLPTYPT
jgi:hypothetical protein